MGKNQERNIKIAKIASLAVIAIVVIIALIFSVIYITNTYFFKDQENQGVVEFAPGIYLEFKENTVKTTSEKTELHLTYYPNKDLSLTPVELKTDNEPGYPNKEYYVVSPEFRSGQNANEQSADFVARCKIGYTNNAGDPLTAEDLELLFSQDFEEDRYKGIMIEIADTWVLGADNYYYYKGSKQNTSASSADDLQAISYAANAEYIKVFKTNADGVAVVKLANQTLENYTDYGIDKFHIILNMEFAEVGSDTITSWFE